MQVAYIDGRVDTPSLINAYIATDTAQMCADFITVAEVVRRQSAEDARKPPTGERQFRQFITKVGIIMD